MYGLPGESDELSHSGVFRVVAALIWRFAYGVVHRRLSNGSDRPIYITGIECPSVRSRLVHKRVLNLNDSDDGTLLPAHSVNFIRIEFCLDPAPHWSGTERLKLLISDSFGTRREVLAAYEPLPGQRPVTTSC